MALKGVSTYCQCFHLYLNWSFYITSCTVVLFRHEMKYHFVLFLLLLCQDSFLLHQCTRAVWCHDAWSNIDKMNWYSHGSDISEPVLIWGRFSIPIPMCEPLENGCSQCAFPMTVCHMTCDSTLTQSYKFCRTSLAQKRNLALQIHKKVRFLLQSLSMALLIQFSKILYCIAWVPLKQVSNVKSQSIV